MKFLVLEKLQIFFDNNLENIRRNPEQCSLFLLSKSQIYIKKSEYKTESKKLFRETAHQVTRIGCF